MLFVLVVLVKNIDRSKAVTLLQNHRLENIAQMKIIPVTEAEIIGIIKFSNQKTQQDMMEFPPKS